MRADSSVVHLTGHRHVQSIEVETSTVAFSAFQADRTGEREGRIVGKDRVPLRILRASEHVKIDRSEAIPRGQRLLVTLELSRVVTRYEQQEFKHRGYRAYGWLLEVRASSVAEIDARTSELKELVVEVEQKAAELPGRIEREQHSRRIGDAREQQEVEQAVRRLDFN